jgi:multidrug resistance efflux pump
MALEKRFDGADSTLARFATLYPRTPQALETAFWRGLFKMDPTNPNTTLATAISLLDIYLEDARDSAHVAEARTMRRVAAKLEGLTRVAENAVSEAREASNTAANAKAQAANANARAEAAKTEATPSSDAEIKRLKDELAKANAELERIRKRLTQPPQKP